MDFLDAFDDDFDYTARSTRPVPFSLEQLQRAVCGSDKAQVEAMSGVGLSAAEPALAGEWATLCQQTLDLSLHMACGEFIQVLRSDSAQALLAPIGAVPDVDARIVPDMATTVQHLRDRATAFILSGSGEPDSLDDDPAHPRDTPAHHRAWHVALVLGACLQLFMQSNWTGPELPAHELDSVYPLPWARPWVEQHAPAELERAAELSAQEILAAQRIGQDMQSRTNAGLAPAEAAPEDPCATGNRAGSVASASDDGMDDKVLVHHLTRPRSRFHSASCAALSIDGEEAYEHVEVPHFLVTARALAEAVAPVRLLREGMPAIRDDLVRLVNIEPCALPAEASATAAAAAAAAAAADAASGAYSAQGWSFPPSGNAAGTRVPAATAEAFEQAVSACPGLLWWAGRAAVIHQRSLVDRHESMSLYGTALACFRRVAQSWASPGELATFVAGDVWQSELVAAILAETQQRDRADGVAATAPGEPATQSLAVSPAAWADRQLRARLLLEWGHAQHFFAQTSAAKTSFFLAKAASGLWTHLTGALGKRTKFQKYDLAQLVLRASSAPIPAALAGQVKAANARTDGKAPELGYITVRVAGQGDDVDLAGAAEGSAGATADQAAAQLAPNAAVNTLGVAELSLDALNSDNVLLERIDYMDEGDAARQAANFTDDSQRVLPPWYTSGWGAALERGTCADTRAEAAAAAAAGPALSDGALTTLDQNVVLALCLDIKNNNPMDGLTRDEMRAYVARVLESPQNWMTYSTGLLLKSRMEFASHHTVERAVLQMQALVDQHTNRLTAMQGSQAAIEQSAPAWQRLEQVYCLVFPSRWELKVQLADHYQQLRVIRSALVLYEELEMWSEIIECHVMLEKLARAERLLRARLAVAPTPRLLCLLGSVTNQDGPFQEAWELSGHRYAKAQTALGKRYYNREAWDEAARAFELALALAQHNARDWFILGVIHMRREDMPAAVHAFRAATIEDPSYADAWANLGGCLLQRDQYKQGYVALQQAVKHKGDSWKMWWNLVRAALAVRDYAKVILGMTKVAQLKTSKHDPGNPGVCIEPLGVLTSIVVEDMARTDDAPPRLGTPRQPSDGAAPSPSLAADVMPELPGDDAWHSDDDSVQSAGGEAADPEPPAPHLAAEQQAGDDIVSLLPEDAKDMYGRRARTFERPLLALFEQLTRELPSHALLWHLHGRLMDAQGKPELGLDSRRKQLRAMQADGWEKDAAQVQQVADLTVRVMQEAASAATRGASVRAAAALGRSICQRVAAAQVVSADMPSLAAVAAESDRLEAAARELV